MIFESSSIPSFPPPFTSQQGDQSSNMGKCGQKSRAPSLPSPESKAMVSSQQEQDSYFILRTKKRRIFHQRTACLLLLPWTYFPQWDNSEPALESLHCAKDGAGHCRHRTEGDTAPFLGDLGSRGHGRLQEDVVFPQCCLECVFPPLCKIASRSLRLLVSVYPWML